MIIKNLIKYIVTCFVFLLSISSAQYLTEDMQSFLRLINGESIFDLEKAFNVKLDCRTKFKDRKSSIGYIDFWQETKCQSYEKVEGAPKISVNNGLTIFRFVEPIDGLLTALDQSSYERARQSIKQSNGMQIYHFEKKIPCSYALCRDFIKIYECSSKPRDRCLRSIQYGRSEVSK